MPVLIPYHRVLTHLQQQGLRSLYHNSGAFGFSSGATTFSRGWIGPEDSSISPAGRAIAHRAPAPFAQNLATAFIRFWQECSPGSIWIMPKSHWAYELQFGSPDWLSDVIKTIGLDPAPLTLSNNAAAIEFALTEAENLKFFVEKLLNNLAGSDFQAVFANARTICTIHSRTQLWWTTVEKNTIDQLDRLLSPDANANHTPPK